MTGRPACVFIFYHLLVTEVFTFIGRILPSWTYGLWLSTSFLTSYSSSTVRGFLQGMQERDCPVRVLHLDCFWMKQYEWSDCIVAMYPDHSLTFSSRCSFRFDPDNFPDPKAYLMDIKQHYGVKICLWSKPFFVSTIWSLD
jgi:alpha-glucosidase (family GH31 glycosyl hydrolase)